MASPKTQMFTHRAQSSNQTVFGVYIFTHRIIQSTHAAHAKHASRGAQWTSVVLSACHCHLEAVNCVHKMLGFNAGAAQTSYRIYMNEFWYDMEARARDIHKWNHKPWDNQIINVNDPMDAGRSRVAEMDTSRLSVWTVVIGSSNRYYCFVTHVSALLICVYHCN